MISFGSNLPPNPITEAYGYLSSRHCQNDPLNTSSLHVQHYPKENDIIHTTHIDKTISTLLSQKDNKGLQVEVDATWVDIPIIQDSIPGYKQW
ncbi:hypothetical protein BDC45DRAFT_564783 [Circinella umbellata]|nr:hypothetical protein BDC45DRAFT_564783 [Circinella umbellata]